MAKASLRSLEARMENQLRAFGYGPQEHEFGGTLNMVQRKFAPEDESERAAYNRKWNNRRTGLAAGITAAAGGTLAYQNREKIKGAAKTGLGKAAAGAEGAGDFLRRQAALGARAAVENPDLKRRVAAKGAGYLGKAAGGIRKAASFFHDVDAIIDLAERVALMELEAEQELTEFNSNLLVGLPDDWQTTGREKAVFDRKGNIIKHKRVEYKQPRKGEPNLDITKMNKDGTWSIDETFGRSDSRIRRAKAVGLAGLTAAGGYAAGKHGPKAIAAAKAARGKMGQVAGAAASRARQLLKK
jgi:hypothetical protein